MSWRGSKEAPIANVTRSRECVRRTAQREGKRRRDGLKLGVQSLQVYKRHG